VLYPNIEGDYYKTFGIVGMWEDQAALENSKTKYKIIAIIFVFCAFNLFVSMILTMVTSPGNIPENTEWDMPLIDEGQGLAPQGELAVSKATS